MIVPGLSNRFTNEMTSWGESWNPLNHAGWPFSAKSEKPGKVGEFRETWKKIGKSQGIFEVF